MGEPHSTNRRIPHRPRLPLVAVTCLLFVATPLLADTTPTRLDADFHITARTARLLTGSNARQIVIAQGDVACWASAHVLRAQNAVLAIEPLVPDQSAPSAWLVQAWLTGRATVIPPENAQPADQALIASYHVHGTIVLAVDRQTQDPHFGQDLLTQATAALHLEPSAPATPSPDTAQPSPPLPQQTPQQQVEAPPTEQTPQKPSVLATPAQPSIPQLPTPSSQIPSVPVYLQPLGPARIQSRRNPDGSGSATYTGGLYLFQRRPEFDSLLELQAQNAVVFFGPAPGDKTPAQDQAPTGPSLPQANVTGVYLEGNVTMTLGDQTFKASSLYYDFTQRSALVLDAVLRARPQLPGDTTAGASLPDQPLYLRADRIRLLNENRVIAEKASFSFDEFLLPHTALRADRIDLLAFDENDNPAPLDQADLYRYQLTDTTANLENTPVFYWPRIAGDSAKPAAPLKRIHTSYDSDYGVSLESEWSLAALLGLRRPAGVDETLLLDEFSKRGPGAGVEMEYRREKGFGSLRSYLVHDHGQDHLARWEDLDDVEPAHQTRGRATWQHRHYLPYDWQATLEISYLSDPTFLEGWREREFDTEKEQETLVYLKQQRDNWAFDFLAKWHLNDFTYTQTQLPAAGFHLAGQKLFDTLTYSHDGHLARLGETAGPRDVISPDGRFHPWTLPGALDSDEKANAISRHSLSLPLDLAGFRLAPTLIGTYSLDDTRSDNNVVQGAAGLRAGWQLWHVDNNAKSKLWDIDRLRHVIIPEASAFWVDSDLTHHNTPDIVNLALRQRWQTYRGPVGQKRSVDFLRFDASVTLVEPDQSGVDLPQKFFFSHPETQFTQGQLLNPDLANLALTTRETWNQAVADHARGQWEWLISDKTAVLGDINYNITDGVISQAGATLAVQRTPRTSYYLGSHFLRNADPFGDGNTPGTTDSTIDSNVLTGGFTYRLNKKYTLGIAHQFDIERGLDSQTRFLLIRKFPHWFGAFSFGIDPSRNSFSLMVSFWPEGFDQLAVGSRRFNRLAW